jgi:hypothetical protein
LDRIVADIAELRESELKIVETCDFDQKSDFSKPADARTAIHAGIHDRLRAKRNFSGMLFPLPFRREAFAQGCAGPA